MKHIVSLILLLIPFLLDAQTTVKGIITEQNSGNKPIPAVQINALGTAPELSDNAGQFQLNFTNKKPGDRIIVSEISKKGYEIVNKDVVNNWVIPGNPGEKTKIVMCPEGTIAQNTMKYYDISLAGLTKTYKNRIMQLQEERDKAQIDAKTFGELAKTLTDQFENQQKQLEKFADKFARENFDDCSTIHKQAFEAFKLGNIEAAIRILETVNSETEIEKAKLQHVKAEKLKEEINDMLIQSDSIIQQNISKLMFQGDLYKTNYQFKEAEKSYEAAVNADTTNIENVYEFVDFLRIQNNHILSIKWANKAIIIAKTDIQKFFALALLANEQLIMYQYEESEANYNEAVKIFRGLYTLNPMQYNLDLAEVFDRLSEVQRAMKQYEKAEISINECLKIKLELLNLNPQKYNQTYAKSLITLGNIQGDMKQLVNAEASLQEGLKIYRNSVDSSQQFYKKNLARALNYLAWIQQLMNKYTQSEASYIESLNINKELANKNPDAYNKNVCALLNNLAFLQNFLKQYDKSEVNQLEALSIERELAKSNPQVYIPQVALMLSNLAYFYYAYMHQFEKSEINYIECLKIYRELAASNPKVFNEHLAFNLYCSGLLYIKIQKYDKAEINFTESLEIYRELSKLKPKVYMNTFADMLKEIAWAQYNTNLTNAIVNTNESINLYLQLIDSVPSVKSSLELNLARMSKYKILAKDFKEAEKSALLALKYNNKLNGARKNLAHSLLFQGKFEEAKSIYLELKEIETPYDKTRKYKDTFLEDLQEFEKAGITHRDVVKIRELLKR